MDYKKIGTFIMTERKAKNLTQEQLAKKLFVSPKTISKWENGNGLPDTNLLTTICEFFNITLNELLIGERLSEANYKENAENNLSKLLSERKTNKQKIVLSAIFVFIGLSILITNILISGYIEIPLWVKILLIGYGIIVFIFGLIIAIYFDITVGSFECRNCGKKFTPKFTKYIFATHTITTRQLKCPHCHKTTNCKKRLNK